MTAQNTTAIAQAAAKRNGLSAQFILQVTELLQRIERTERARAQMHRVRINNDWKASRIEKAFTHDFDMLVAAAAEIRSLLNEGEEIL